MSTKGIVTMQSTNFWYKPERVYLCSVVKRSEGYNVS